MKTLFAILALALSATAFAGQVELPEPTLATMLNIAGRCAPDSTPNDVATIYARQAITGWSADGTQLYAVTSGSLPHGNCYGGRGISYYRWCGTLTWTVTVDQFGNLNPVGTATYTPGNCSGGGGTFYNASNYGATIEVTQDPWSPSYYWDVATLLTP